MDFFYFCIHHKTAGSCSKEAQERNKKTILEKEKQILYTNTYIWNLEKWYRWTYLQGRNRGADVENGPGHMGSWGGERRGWQELRVTLMYIHSLQCVRQLVGSCYITQEPSLVFCEDVGGEMVGREAPGRGNVCLLTADSSCSTTEPNTT